MKLALTFSTFILAVALTARGNEYCITIGVETNKDRWPAWQQTDRLPKRVSIQLSTDGGSNYTRTLAYGLPVISNYFTYTYSPPWDDDSIFTYQARLRVIDLTGQEWGTSNFLNFKIFGLHFIEPEDGATLLHGSTIALQWVSLGSGPTGTLGYITPTVPFTPLCTVSNLVDGTNTFWWQASNLPYPVDQLELVLRSDADAKIWGATGVLSTE